METTAIDISTGEPNRHHRAGAERMRALLARQLSLLVACVLLALVPFFAPRSLIDFVTRFGVVLYYSALSLVAGWFGIRWIWQATRTVLPADDEAATPRGGP
jgi:hypothetical protein